MRVLVARALAGRGANREGSFRLVACTQTLRGTRYPFNIDEHGHLRESLATCPGDHGVPDTARVAPVLDGTRAPD